MTYYTRYLLILVVTLSRVGCFRAANSDTMYTESKTYIISPDTGGTGGSNMTDNSHLYYHQNMIPDNEDPTVEPNLVYYTPYPYGGGGHYDPKNFESQAYDYSPRERYHHHHHHHGHGKYPESDKSSKGLKKLKKRRRPTGARTTSNGNEASKVTGRSKNARRHPSIGNSRRLRNKGRKGGDKAAKRRTKYESFKKKQKVDRQQDDDYDYSREEEDDYRDEPDEEGSSIDNLFDLPELSDGELDDMENDLVAEDEDPAQEETFPRPSIIDLDDGLDLAAAGLSGIRNTVMPNLGLSLRGMRRFLRPFLRSRRLTPRRFFSSATKLLFIFFLLPLLLLFLPIPILSSNTNGTNSRNGFATPAEQMVDLGKRVLNSEQCLERISCEINRWSKEAGEDSNNKLFTKLMKITYKMDSIFPAFMVRMAKGYVGVESDNSTMTSTSSGPLLSSPCLRFECSRVPNL